MIEAEFEEIDEVAEREQQLDLSEDDSLPWLESDEEESSGGFDFVQFAGFFAILLALLGAMVGGIWLLSNSGKDTEIVTKGRHDPCVGLRATPIAEAMVALVLIDHYLRHRAQNADVNSETPKL